MEQKQIIKNGKYQFLKRIKCKVYCAKLEIRTRWNGKDYVDADKAIVKPIKLKVGYNQEEYDLFLNKIDIPFDDVLAWDERLYGTIWMEDGSWYTINYDEEYMFQSFYHHKHPEIPNELTDDYDEVVLLDW